MKYLLLTLLILLFSCLDKKTEAPQSGKSKDSTQIEVENNTDAKSGASKKTNQ